MFRELHGFMQSNMQGKGRVEVLSLAVMAEGVTADEFDNTQSSRPAGLTSSTAAAVAAPMAALSIHERPAGMSESMVASTTGVAVARAPVRRGPAAAAAEAGSSGGDIVYRGLIAGIPDAHASRKERFAELDTLQPGWEVELRSKGDTVEAVFYSPAGERVGAYANARRMALQAHKASAAAGQ